jgi:hypothetical protein
VTIETYPVTPCVAAKLLAYEDRIIDDSNHLLDHEIASLLIVGGSTKALQP